MSAPQIASTSSSSDWEFFVDLTKQAQLWPCKEAFFANPTDESPFNDDVDAPLYKGQSHTFAGRQTKGVLGDIPEPSSVYHPVELDCHPP